ncbi:hypothetical protein KPH14_012612 [Odynerus spinipes]|uniref:Uncharacterized protein n=1 Tax=Odynerus spinipes TaxID=1348599 RepID=A0AAD9RF63_9HYME|nr:hypothetical protein KPH14_012612 [Odynerus spinipes]
MSSFAIASSLADREDFGEMILDLETQEYFGDPELDDFERDFGESLETGSGSVMGKGFKEECIISSGRKEEGGANSLAESSELEPIMIREGTAKSTRRSSAMIYFASDGTTSDL